MFMTIIGITAIVFILVVLLLIVVVVVIVVVMIVLVVIEIVMIIIVVILVVVLDSDRKIMIVIEYLIHIFLRSPIILYSTDIEKNLYSFSLDSTSMPCMFRRVSCLQI